MRPLRTARLELRPLRADDLAIVAALNADPRVMAPLGGVLSAAETQVWLDRQLRHHDRHGYGRLLVTCAAQVVGLVGLSRTDLDRGIVPEVEVAWRLAFAHWGRGFATEAASAVIEHGFTNLGLHEVIAVTNVSNTRSRAVMARSGMWHSASESFEHPLLADNDPLRRHVIYRLRRSSM
jgi:RimJ/RimL family protein N-acetyltransferase